MVLKLRHKCSKVPTDALLETGPLFRLGTLGTCLGRKKVEGENRGQMKITANVPQSLASYERRIPALKRVKTEMRSTMENEKLNSLMLLCTQNDITMEIDYNDVVNDFAMIKSRGRPLLYKYYGRDTIKNKYF
ncbi:hypothetical protein TNCV_5135601 [Trichonephila clavipes]|nr:hypothetical protein TNCV_5135601 [Trichonephila clavipes]